jgi:predicted transcriptional regulator
MGRHRLPETHKQYQVEQMWELHHEVCRLALIGMKQVDIATHLGVSPVMVSYTLRSPIVQRQLNQLKAVRDIDAIDVAKEIQALAPRAVRVLDELMDSELPNIKLKAATDILDRAGHAAVRTLRTENIHAHFTADEISDIKKRAREVGLLTDAMYEEEEVNVNSNQAG